MSESTTGFLSVFEQRVHLLRRRLKDELDKKKSERNKDILKSVIKEIKEWEVFLKQHRQDNKRCPHCDGIIN